MSKCLVLSGNTYSLTDLYEYNWPAGLYIIKYDEQQAMVVNVHNLPNQFSGF